MCKTNVNALQIERLEQQQKDDPDALLIVPMKQRDLTRDVIPILEAGIEAARRLGKKNTAALWDKTDTAAAWDPKIQAEALARSTRTAGSSAASVGRTPRSARRTYRATQYGRDRLHPATRRTA